MITLIRAAIACVLGLFWAQVMEYVAIQFYGTPIPSAASVAGMTFFGTSLFVFGLLQILTSDRR